MKKAVWRSIVADVSIAVLCLTSFAYIKYVRPQSERTVAVVNAQESEDVETTEDLQAGTQTGIMNPAGLSRVTFQEANPDAEIIELKQHISTDGQLMTDTYQIRQIRNEQEESIFVTDIFTTDVKKIQTAFSQDTYGFNIRELPMDMMNRHNGMIGISGDNYGESESGICVRNGEWYRTQQNSNDVCVLYEDGSMETYTSQEYDEDIIRPKGVWQAWSFGPSLLDEHGEVLDQFNSNEYVLARNPRCGIGFVEPGHYLMIVVDGREEGYSLGLNMTEFAQLCKELGCMKAYNLDGGKTATMMTSEELLNKPCENMYKQGGREMTDIIYVEN